METSSPKSVDLHTAERFIMWLYVSQETSCTSPLLDTIQQPKFLLITGSDLNWSDLFWSVPQRGNEGKFKELQPYPDSDKLAENCANINRMFSLYSTTFSVLHFFLEQQKKGTRIISAYTDGVFPHKATKKQTNKQTEGDNTNDKRWNCETWYGRV